MYYNEDGILVEEEGGEGGFETGTNEINPEAEIKPVTTLEELNLSFTNDLEENIELLLDAMKDYEQIYVGNPRQSFTLYYDLTSNGNEYYHILTNNNIAQPFFDFFNAAVTESLESYGLSSDHDPSIALDEMSDTFSIAWNDDYQSYIFIICAESGCKTYLMTANDTREIIKELSEQLRDIHGTYIYI